MKLDTARDYPPYSVLMPLYKNDNPDWFMFSLESILNQTVKPSEIVILCDGEITNSLRCALDFYESSHRDLIIVHQLNKNVGLGRALNRGICLCKNEYIARMDADDFATKERCEKQLDIFLRFPEIDMVGSNVEEFVDNIDNVVSHVVLPKDHKDIVLYAKRRCPVRHPTLMFKKNSVLKAGNYSDYRHAQDYDLIVHMIMSGARIYNVQENLVFMRVSNDFYKRRGGIKQAKLILKLKYGFYKCGFYSIVDFAISGIGNALVALLPNQLREIVYIKLLRK